jgi:5'-nucleotidase
VHILLTNDDGIKAKGIQTLAEFCRTAGHEVVIAAPSSERSASSHSITLRRPVKVTALGNNEFSIDGTPVDCVIIAVQKLIRKPIDLVISGINAGQNMGEDIHYSGTVAAAKEAAFLGYKAIAISLTSYSDQLFSTAASWLMAMINNGLADILSTNQVLNVNVPNLASDQIKGIRLTNTGHRKYYNFLKLIEEEQDSFTYMIGGDLPVWEEIKGSDAEAVREGFVSLTPIGFDMTKGDSFPVLLEWLEEAAENIINETV